MPTKTELKQHAKELKIKGFSKMNKEHLESAIYLKSVCTWYDSLTEGNTDKVNDRSDRDFGSLQDVAVVPGVSSLSCVRVCVRSAVFR